MIKVKSFFQSWKMLMDAIAVVSVILVVCFVDFSKETPTQPKTEKQLRAELLETYKNGNQNANNPATGGNQKDPSGIDRNAVTVIETKTANRQVLQAKANISYALKTSESSTGKSNAARNIEQSSQNNYQSNPASSNAVRVVSARPAESSPVANAEARQSGDEVAYPSTLAEVMQAKRDIAIKRKQTAAKAQTEASYQKVRDLLAQKIGVPPVSPVSEMTAMRNRRGAAKPASTQSNTKVKYGNSTPIPRYPTRSARRTRGVSGNRRLGLGMMGTGQKAVKLGKYKAN